MVQTHPDVVADVISKQLHRSPSHASLHVEGLVTAKVVGCTLTLPVLCPSRVRSFGYEAGRQKQLPTSDSFRDVFCLLIVRIPRSLALPVFYSV